MRHLFAFAFKLKKGEAVALMTKGILPVPVSFLLPKLVPVRSVSFFLPQFRCRTWVMKSPMCLKMFI